MTHFGVPSSSVDIAPATTQDTNAGSFLSTTTWSTDRPTELPSRVRQSTKLQKSHASSRRARRGHRLEKIKTAIKDAAKRDHKNKKLAEPCNLFVGNIGPDVDEDALRQHFGCCGKILSVRIHCCGGVAMTVIPPPASFHRNLRVRQYAIITFGSKLARRRACKLEGTVGGRQLKASIFISDLPEVQEKITKRLEEYRLRQESPDVHRAQNSALKSLKIDPTELIDARYESERRRRNQDQFMGLSLFYAIM